MDVGYGIWVQAVATTVLCFITAFYAWQVRQQVLRDRKLDDPNLQVFMALANYYDTGNVNADKGCSVEYTALLVNPGNTPLAITGFEEKIAQERDPDYALRMRGKFDPPEERPARLFISDLPWAIGSRDFAVWRRRFPPELWESCAIVEGIVYVIDVTWRYRVGEKERTATGITRTAYLRERVR